MTNAGTQEMVTRIIAAESITRECLGRIVQMQTEINELQKDKEEGRKNKTKKGIKSDNVKEAGQHTPSVWEGKGSKVSFKEFSEGVKNWADALSEHGVKILEAVETSQDMIDVELVKRVCIIADDQEAEDLMKDFEARLYRMLKKYATSEAAKIVQNPKHSYCTK